MRNQYDVDRLLFRRQFILGPRFVERFVSWKRICVKAGLCLTVHPDLNTYQVVHGDKSVTLLGYILDPYHPQASDADIIGRLVLELDAGDSIDSFWLHTQTFGGRWILIGNNGREVKLFHDPMGLRQVFYTDLSCLKDLWCASQPGIIAEVLNLEMDPYAVSVFLNSEVIRNWDEAFWPGDGSPYKEIKHLLPNHCLDLNTGLCRRYWPDKNLGRLSLEDGIDKVSYLLPALIKSAHNRFGLAFTITAGWDSRLLLAASREIRHQVGYFSLLRRPNDPDVVVPTSLLSKLGLRHHVIKYPRQMDRDFERIYKRNVTTAHDLWGSMAQGLYNSYPPDKVCVKGNASEICRVRLRLPEGERITAEKLAKLTWLIHQDKLGQNPYIIQSWAKWLAGLGKLYDVHILDLFYWEHYAGNFAAMTQAEWDIVQEVLTPYNCRELLMTMLAVDERFRDHDEPILYRELIKRLWAEVLSEPVNPPRRSPLGEQISQVPRRLRRWGRSVRDNMRSNA